MYTNRLIHEKSPYLLQHAHNPVDWFAWNEEAFAKARDEDKPIFLSVGYSTCHWCHVMERESFEDEDVAQILNREFVPIKVDREERPDVDRVYMMFVQASTGSGGWPMSVWLTPDLKPFYGGTYFPPDNRYGRPGFKNVLESVANAWHTSRTKIAESSSEAIRQLKEHAEVKGASTPLNPKWIDSCYFQCRRMFDTKLGGFGGAPKFPRPVLHNFLLRYYASTGNEEALDMVVKTLHAMARGGMHDQLGGGFHRYSVDERWFVPHFEKMLYDQAQLAISYLEAYQITKDATLAQTARDILDYVLRDMTHPEGGFYSAEDADSVIDPAMPEKKGEGAFYVWTRDEIEHLLGPETAKRFAATYGIRAEGNVDHDPQGEFTGKNILYRAGESEGLIEAKATLLAARSKRVRPHLDDKIITAWNALMISAFAKAAQVLNEERYLDAAIRATEFVIDKMYDPQLPSLARRFRNGDAGIPGFLDDYAFFANALIDMYETTFEYPNLRLAVRLTDRMLALFEDKEHGAFFSTPADEPDLVMRVKDDYDGAEPSGNSMAVMALLRLAQYTGRQDYLDSATKALNAFGPRMEAAPHAIPQMMAAFQFSRANPRQVVVAGGRDLSKTRKMIELLHSQFAPDRIVLLIDSPETREKLAAGLPMVKEMAMAAGDTTAYVCENNTCRLPTSDMDEFRELLK